MSFRDIGFNPARVSLDEEAAPDGEVKQPLQENSQKEEFFFGGEAQGSFAISHYRHGGVLSGSAQAGFVLGAQVPKFRFHLITSYGHEEARASGGIAADFFSLRVPLGGPLGPTTQLYFVPEIDFGKLTGSTATFSHEEEGERALIEARPDFLVRGCFGGELARSSPLGLGTSETFVGVKGCAEVVTQNPVDDSPVFPQARGMLHLYVGSRLTSRDSQAEIEVVEEESVLVPETAPTVGKEIPVFDGDVKITKGVLPDDFKAFVEKNKDAENKTPPFGIKGNLVIEKTDLSKYSTELAALESLVEITGNLIISSSVASEDFDYVTNRTNKKTWDLNILNGLEMVGGTMVITNNSGMVSLDGFARLRHIGGPLLITGNKDLKEIKGFKKVVYVKNNIQIASNPVLEDISGFPKVTTLTGFLMIQGNPKLQTINAFGDLVFVRDIIIQSNEDLETIAGFDGLKRLTGDLQIIDNPSLTGVTVSFSPYFIYGGITIKDNDLLADLFFLNDLKRVDPNRVEIFGNRVIDQSHPQASGRIKTVGTESQDLQNQVTLNYSEVHYLFTGYLSKPAIETAKREDKYRPSGVSHPDATTRLQFFKAYDGKFAELEIPEELYNELILPTVREAILNPNEDARIVEVAVYMYSVYLAPRDTRALADQISQVLRGFLYEPPLSLKYKAAAEAFKVPPFVMQLSTGERATVLSDLRILMSNRRNPDISQMAASLIRAIQLVEYTQAAQDVSEKTGIDLRRETDFTIEGYAEILIENGLKNTDSFDNTLSLLAIFDAKVKLPIETLKEIVTYVNQTKGRDSDWTSPVALQGFRSLEQSLTQREAVELILSDMLPQAIESHSQEELVGVIAAGTNGLLAPLVPDMTDPQLQRAFEAISPFIGSADDDPVATEANVLIGIMVDEQRKRGLR